MYIDGNWIEAENKNIRDIINPFNQEVVAKVTEADVSDMKTAIKAARHAFDNGTWPTMTMEERSSIVQRIAELILRDKEELAELESLDTGKTVEESRVDMDDISELLPYHAEIPFQVNGEGHDSPLPGPPGKPVLEPVGVCGQITPRNYPLLQASWKLAPALVAGNTLILKPSEITPLTCI